MLVQEYQYVDFYFSGAADDPVYILSSPVDIDSDVSEKNEGERLVILLICFRLASACLEFVAH